MAEKLPRKCPSVLPGTPFDHLALWTTYAIGNQPRVQDAEHYYYSLWMLTEPGKPYHRRGRLT